jgi:hypothetical protein
MIILYWVRYIYIGQPEEILGKGAALGAGDQTAWAVTQGNPSEP